MAHDVSERLTSACLMRTSHIKVPPYHISPWKSPPRDHATLLPFYCNVKKLADITSWFELAKLLASFSFSLVRLVRHPHRLPLLKQPRVNVWGNVLGVKCPTSHGVMAFGHSPHVFASRSYRVRDRVSGRRQVFREMSELSHHSATGKSR